MPKPLTSPGNSGKARPKPAFPKKNEPPAPATFAALLPFALGRRLESVRGFLGKQKDVTEDVYFYGPKAGWGLRYRVALASPPPHAITKPLCALFVHGSRPLGVLSLDAAMTAAVDWKALSPVARQARRAAHGSPQLLWLDVSLDGTGAADFRALLSTRIEALRSSQGG